MSVIPLTVFFSLLLAGLFIGLFAHEQRRRRFTSAEHDSLLPLAEEHAVPARPGRPHPTGRCGCRDGTRPPCPGCLKQVPDDDIYF